ncbi:MULTISPECIES: tail fiber domain-containing protein [unclassified Moorena]|uniref:tail fiber domain-containing protein n=1 Tax=unclassified Moorena TaxID=2683338 RepID=UPI0013FEB2AE|nr:MULTISPECIES: tail fiber domain-containing protein [unclassified Moorena]NEO15011.1 tail fiber domain-containing protein [Moorena sp. SIO3E8]NEQ01415.1 tail fiber domain-containing protein [Moorena sp. SIO3F7]
MKNIQRPNYFTSQFLVEEDFKDEQAYHRDMRLRHNRLLHEWGVVEGLEVTRAGDKKIAVSKGMAIDKDGQEIIVLPNCTVPDTINTINLDGLPLKATIEITVMYREIKDKGYRVGSEIKYTRTTERPKFVIYGSNTSQDNLQDGNVDLKNADSPPPEDNVILLARVTLDNDGKISAVDNYVRKLAGAKLSTADAFRVRYDYNFFGANQDALVIEQRDLNHPNPDGGIAFVNTGDDGVVETALVIKGNGNVGIGTNNPSEKIEVAGTVKATNLNLTGDSTIDGSLTVAGNLEVQGDVIARDTEHMPGNVSLGNGDNDQVIIAGVIRSEHSSGALRVDDALHTTGALTVDGNVGIGTTSIHNPQDWNKVLDILGSQHARLNVRSGGGVVTSVFSHDSWNGARGVIGTESNHPLTFATNYQHRMTIDPNGNVGIGTTNPQSLLQVGDGLGGGNRPWMTTGLQVAWDSDNVFLGLKDEGADRKDSVLAWGDNTNDVFRFIFAASGGAADGQEIMRLQPNGNVGIGTNNPSEKLEVAGTVKATKFQGAGNSTIDGSLTVNGLLEVKGNVSLGDADNDEVTIAGVIRSGHSSGALRVDDALHTTGPLTVDGNLSVGNAIATAQLSVTDRVTGSLTIENNLTVGGVLASTLEVSGALKLATTGTQIFHSTNESGTPTGDGFRLRYDNNFFGTSQDALVIEKTDGNNPNPDGGIAFVNTGNDGVEETALVIKGNGNVGIGTTNPSQKLEVAGTVKATRFEGDDSAFGSLTVDGNVGIGTTSIHNPQGWHKVLDILGSQHARLNVRSGGGVVTSVFSHDDWNGARGVIGTESNHPLTFATNYQHRMTIDPNGNVGIGTTNPQSLLQVGVGGISAPRPWMTRGLQVAWDTDHLFLGLKDQGADRKDSVLAWGDNTNDAFRFIFAASGGAADGQEIMRLQPNGNVGIGTNNPSEKLEVAGTVKATNLNLTGDSIIDGSLTVNGLLEVKGNVSLGDADNDEVKVTGVIRSGHSSGALRVDDALHTTGALTVDGNVGIGTTNPSEKLEVAGTVKATNFEGDGSALTGISAGKWSDGGSNKIYYNAGNVGIGTNNPIEKLEVDGAVKATKFEGDGSGLTGISAGGETKWSDGDSNSIYYNAGNVGIGTKTPKSTQHIVGDLVLGKDANNQKFIFHSRTFKNGDLLHFTCDKPDGEWDWNKGIIFYRNGNITIRNSKLEVSGTVKATKFEGDGSGLTGISGDGKWQTLSGNHIRYNGGVLVGNYLLPRTNDSQERGVSGASFAITEKVNNIPRCYGVRGHFQGFLTSIVVKDEKHPDDEIIVKDEPKDTTDDILKENISILGGITPENSPESVKSGDFLEERTEISVEAVDTIKGGTVQPIDTIDTIEGDIPSKPLLLKSGYGGYFTAINSGAFTVYGVYSEVTGSEGSTSFGVYGSAIGAGNNYAGYFNGRVHVTGNITAKEFIRANNLQQRSSRQLKENINTLAIEDAIETLEGLNPVQFRYKEDHQKETHIGFIAEDVPDLVASSDRKTLSPMDIVAVLTKVVKEQNNTISLLMEKVQTLEHKSQ